MTIDTLLSVLAIQPAWWWCLAAAGLLAVFCAVLEALACWLAEFHIPSWSLVRGECADTAWKQHQDWCRDYCGAGRPCDIGRGLQRRQRLAA